MGSQVGHEHPDRRVARIASAQHGVVSRPQLLAAGLRPRSIHHRLATGRLHSLHRGVYAVGHRALTREGTWLAAALACGDGAVISHLDAAELWGLVRSHGRGPVHVTVPTRAGRARRDGIRVHRVPLAAGDVMRRRSVEVTTVARTLVDVAALLDGRPLERALDEAHYLGLLDSSVLAVTLDRNAGRAGARRLGAVLAGHEPGSTRTRSELEERFLALCSAHRLPRPRVNVVVDGLEVDFLWAASRVIVETDGYAAHNGLGAFERDHERDLRLRAARYEVLRFTWRQVTTRGRWVAESVADALGERPGA